MLTLATAAGWAALISAGSILAAGIVVVSSRISGFWRAGFSGWSFALSDLIASSICVIPL